MIEHIDFMISYWVRKNNVIRWCEEESIIDFENMFYYNGSILTTRKFGTKYIIYMLDQKLGNIKITQESINEYLKDDLFVVIGVKENILKLYFNGKLKALYDISQLINTPCEIKDRVLVRVRRNDLDNIKTDDETVLPAIIEGMYKDNYTFFFKEMNQRVVLNKNRLFKGMLHHD